MGKLYKEVLEKIASSIEDRDDDGFVESAALREVIEYVEQLERKLSLYEKLDMAIKTTRPDIFNHYFICGESGEKDHNGLPEQVSVCPAYGADFSVRYKKIDE